MQLRKVIINSVHTLEIPLDSEEEANGNDVALIGEIGIIPYLQSHSDFIMQTSYDVGSMIIERDELQVEVK